MTGPARYPDEPDADPDFDDTQPPDEDANEEPEFDPDFDLPEPAPENDDPDPDDYADGDLDDGPKGSVNLGDAYDREQGYPTDAEDIAIVAWEALRAYRMTQGAPSGTAWMHARPPHKDEFMKRVRSLSEGGFKFELKHCEDPESKLLVSIVNALRP
jgi:hypothetical protein